VAFFFDERGRLELIRVVESTGHEELDQAAARVAGVIHFSVNQLGDPPACWATVLPVTFTTR
jgi:TonB family protein